MKTFWGWIGEKKTAFTMWLNLDATYTRFHDVILPGKDGTTQIDHLIIAPYGIFIVETKNLKGWIFGTYDQPRWTQVIYGYKYHFQNPIRQTFRQKKTLAEYLGIDESLIYTIIYFNGRCTFKTLPPSNVINTNLASYIKTHKEQVLSHEKINDIHHKIVSLSLDASLTTKNHIKSLRSRYSSTTTCPKCGAALVERTASKGTDINSKFLGCANYPKCRFTKSI